MWRSIKEIFLITIVILAIFLLSISIVIVPKYNNLIKDYEMQKATYDLIRRYKVPKLLNNPTYENLKKLIKYQKEIDEINNDIEELKIFEKIKEMKPIENILEKEN